ncbi:MAG TPA: DinB family protein [Roseivirga sp.]
MKLKATTHIENSVSQCEKALTEVKQIINGLDDHTLNTQEGEGKWSILQCLKHLSIANKIYVENIGNAFEKYPQKPEETFKSHWKGDYFTKMISPKEKDVVKNKMKTMKSMDPKQALKPKETIEEFFSTHQELIELMRKSENYSLNQVKVPTALGPLVKLRLGDAFRFLLGHLDRHVIQLKRIKKAVA